MPGFIAQLFALSSLHSNCETGERLVLCRTKSVFGAQKWPFSIVSYYVFCEKPGKYNLSSAKMLRIPVFSH